MDLTDKYGFCPVTEPEQRKEHLKLLERKLELLSQLRDSLAPKQLIQYKEDLERFKQLSRIDRAEHDVLFFMYQYLSDDLNPTNNDNLVPAGVSIDEAPDFHVELCQMLNVVSNEEINKRVAWASPRGSAKSAYLSNCFPLHQIVFQKRKYILIISETQSISQRFMEFIGNQLKFNELLREDFGELLSPQKQKNDIDNLDNFKTTSGTLVEASSMGSQLRGKRNGSHRPDCLIFDDVESSKNTNTKELRERNLHWFDSVCLPIGDPHKTAFLYMGTMVHQDGLLNEVMSRPDFQSRLFSAIVQEPERQDLWDELEQMLRTTDPDRLLKAKAFYQDNKAEMEKGVEVLWSQKWTYFDLMLLKASMTTRSFNGEYRNNPTIAGESLYNPSEFTYITEHELEQLKHRLYLVGAWDLAFTSGKRSDFNAVTILGKDRYDSNKIYVVEAWAEKLDPTEALEKVYQLIMKYQPVVFSVEVVGGSIGFFTQLQKKLNDTPNNRTRLKQLKTNRSMGTKEQRLESMEPIVKSGQLIFQRKHTMLLDQFELFPYSPHDDSMDSCYQALQLIGITNRPRSFRKKPNGL
ncbi:hypothetical protein [Peribacillus simplex]|uniref:phage terminase large subunit family protein n=1 Tax=Peribacillus simplex TaxID=1478 RepID=UPI0011A46E94|nr:hypothetical protein [Peribacillus simplex]